MPTLHNISKAYPLDHNVEPHLSRRHGQSSKTSGGSSDDTYATCIDGVYQPKWIIQRAANNTNSPVYTLRGGLIFLIAVHLELEAVRLLRQTSRIFRDNVPAWLAEPLCYTDNSSSNDNDPNLQKKKQTELLFTNDTLCQPCRNFRDDGRYNKALQALHKELWCSGCSEYHTRAIFSAKQAQNKSNATRVCILHEGRVRLCAHASRDWAQLHESAARFLRFGMPQRLVCWHCKYNDEDYEVPVLRVIPRHERLFMGQAEDDLEYGIVPVSINTRNRVLSLDHAGPVTRKALQDALETHRDTLGCMLCPHFTIDDDRLMLLSFGPDTCACFDPEPQNAHDCCGFEHGCCRCRANRNDGRSGLFMPAFKVEKGRLWYGGGEGGDHQWRCQDCDTVYWWERQGKDVFVHVKRMIPLRSEREGWDGFAENLDPVSWGAHEDEALRGVAYCEDDKCARRRGWACLTKLGRKSTLEAWNPIESWW
ncbi:hypothetical protein M406DRAFT_67639 [Cryphonectria parasitica EP155]|uniref:Uncharacterized protein n=1 Tax=Cryphonectria parasitica (strain ATCC 38755 / EP155) TaxID=660469 RepID=A0A9P4YFL2_CRYP1|nr:uncharacterized protein M406DRAFT_67639 [Cryphonectria parasitica EP155]KAF3771330.1 hypothetical protein M406DRAFT_67639 [Cryphonectria parasitica EP155]